MTMKFALEALRIGHEQQHQTQGGIGQRFDTTRSCPCHDYEFKSKAEFQHHVAMHATKISTFGGMVESRVKWLEGLCGNYTSSGFDASSSALLLSSSAKKFSETSGFGTDIATAGIESASMRAFVEQTFHTILKAGLSSAMAASSSTQQQQQQQQRLGNASAGGSQFAPAARLHHHHHHSKHSGSAGATLSLSAINAPKTTITFFNVYRYLVSAVKTERQFEHLKSQAEHLKSEVQLYSANDTSLTLHEFALFLQHSRMAYLFFGNGMSGYSSASSAASAPSSLSPSVRRKTRRFTTTASNENSGSAAAPTIGGGGTSSDVAAASNSMWTDVGMTASQSVNQALASSSSFLNNSFSNVDACPVPLPPPAIASSSLSAARRRVATNNNGETSGQQQQPSSPTSLPTFVAATATTPLRRDSAISSASAPGSARVAFSPQRSTNSTAAAAGASVMTGAAAGATIASASSALPSVLRSASRLNPLSAADKAELERLPNQILAMPDHSIRGEFFSAILESAGKGGSSGDGRGAVFRSIVADPEEVIKRESARGTIGRVLRLNFKSHSIPK